MNSKDPAKIEIIAIGTELLSPFYLDTNSLILTSFLNELGFIVSFKTVVGDDQRDLVLRLKQSLRAASLIFIIGGLGPTKDDRTREAVAEVLGRRLVFQKQLLEKIEARFSRRQLKMPPPNKRQAYLVQGAEALENKNGTAPGQWIKAGRKLVVLLPGPPHEFKAMLEDSVRPRLLEKRRGFLIQHVLKTTGLTESQVEEAISDLYPRDRDRGMTLLASPGQIEIHLQSFSKESRRRAEEKITPLRIEILRRLKAHVFSQSGEELEKVVGDLLKKMGKTLATAESCSGGMLSHRLTNVPGSSEYYLEGVVAYTNKAKADELGVPLVLLQKHGAVSSPVAGAMARGIRRRAGSDYGLAITGIAGPAGGAPDKPVGLVFTALSGKEGTKVQRNLFLGRRELIKFQSAQKALDMLRRRLHGGMATRKSKRK